MSDKACHKIFESLFRLVSTEKTLYNRANSKGASSSKAAATRLSACASVVRTAVETFLHNLRIKSVRAILDHITNVLVSPDSALFELLSVDYTKCLSTILHYPPHVEHLGVEEWESVLKFCLKVVNVPNDHNSQQSTWSPHSSVMDDYLGASGGRSTPSRMTPSLAVREKPKGPTGVVEEALSCIKILSAVPNAPLQDNAESILLGLASYVGSPSFSGSGHQTAFSAINAVAMGIIFDNSELVRVALLDLVPVIRQHWTTKLIGLKDELLVTTMLLVTFLTDDIRRKPDEALIAVIDGLINTLQREYFRRSEKDILQVDELVFDTNSTGQHENFRLWPRLESPRSEHNWTVVWIMARLLELSEELTTRLSTHSPAEAETPSKRQRISSKIDDVFRDSTASFGIRRVCALQLIPFLLNHYACINSKVPLLERLIPNINDDNATISSWTMIAIAW